MAKPKIAGEITLDESKAAAALKRIGAAGAAVAAKLDADFAKGINGVNSAVLTGAKTAAVAFAATAAAATAAAYAIGRGVAQQLEAGRSLNIMARQTGASVAGLVVLQAKFKQAGLAGDMVATSIARLQKSIAGVEDEENRGGSKRLQQLGLNLLALQKASPDRQLLLVGQAISAIKDPAERAGTAMQIFGRAGAQLGTVFNGNFGQVSVKVQQQAAIMARNAAIFEQASIRLEHIGNITKTFYLGVADRVSETLLPILEQVERINLVGIGQQFGDQIARAGQIFAGIFTLPATAFDAVENGLKFAFASAGNVLVAGMRFAADVFRTGMGAAVGGLGDLITATMMRAFDGPIRYFQAGLESALQTMQFMSDLKAGKKADPLGDMSEETRQQQLKQVRRLKDQMEAKGNVVGNPSYREALKYEARLRDYDPSKYAHAPEDTATIMNRRKNDPLRFALMGSGDAAGMTADQYQLRGAAKAHEVYRATANAFQKTPIEDVFGASRYSQRTGDDATKLRGAGAVSLGLVSPGPSYDEVAEQEDAVTNPRPATLPHARRPETLPHKRGAETLPAPVDRPLSAPSTPVPAAPWSFGGSWMGKMLANILSPAQTEGAATLTGIGMQTAPAMKPSTGLWGGNPNLQAMHTIGMGGALDFDPSTRPGWTGASNFGANFTAKDWANYKGDSGGVFGRNGTGLTTGGLGGGAYGATGNIWTQLSGRTGGKTPEQQSLGHLAKIASNTEKLAQGLGPAAGTATNGGGAAATG